MLEDYHRAAEKDLWAPKKLFYNGKQWVRNLGWVSAADRCGCKRSANRDAKCDSNFNEDKKFAIQINVLALARICISKDLRRKEG